MEDKVREEVGRVIDPETGMTFAEMQMITSVKEEEPGTVKVEFIPTSPFCPIAFKMASDIKDAAKKVPYEAIALYSKGLAAKDAGNKSEAVSLFQKSLDKFPQFEKAQAELKKLQ